MDVLRDVFPFNLPPGMAFFGVYAVFGIILAIAIKLLRDAVGSGLDRADASRIRTTAQHMGGYRAHAPGVVDTLGIASPEAVAKSRRENTSRPPRTHSRSVPESRILSLYSPLKSFTNLPGGAALGIVGVAHHNLWLAMCICAIVGVAALLERFYKPGT